MLYPPDRAHPVRARKIYTLTTPATTPIMSTSSAPFHSASIHAFMSVNMRVLARERPVELAVAVEGKSWCLSVRDGGASSVSPLV